MQCTSASRWHLERHGAQGVNKGPAFANSAHRGSAALGLGDTRTVGQLPQLIVWWQRLRVTHIQRSTANAALTQCCKAVNTAAWRGKSYGDGGELVQGEDRSVGWSRSATAAASATASTAAAHWHHTATQLRYRYSAMPDTPCTSAAWSTHLPRPTLTNTACGCIAAMAAAFTSPCVAGV